MNIDDLMTYEDGKHRGRGLALAPGFGLDFVIPYKFDRGGIGDVVYRSDFP